MCICGNPHSSTSHSYISSSIISLLLFICKVTSLNLCIDIIFVHLLICLKLLSLFYLQTSFFNHFIDFLRVLTNFCILVASILGYYSFLLLMCALINFFMSLRLKHVPCILQTFIVIDNLTTYHWNKLNWSRHFSNRTMLLVWHQHLFDDFIVQGGCTNCWLCLLEKVMFSTVEIKILVIPAVPYHWIPQSPPSQFEYTRWQFATPFPNFG